MLSSVNDDTINAEIKKCVERKEFLMLMMENNVMYKRKQVCRQVANLVKQYSKLRDLTKMVQLSEDDILRKRLTRRQTILKRLVPDNEKFNSLRVVCFAITLCAKMQHGYIELQKKSNIVNKSYRAYDTLCRYYDGKLIDIDISIEMYNARIESIEKERTRFSKTVEKAYRDIDKKWGHLYQHEEHTCPICLDDDTNMVETTCGHHFHVACLMSYVYNILVNSIFSNIEIRCPMCRGYI